MGKQKIKTRKQRELEYADMFGNVSIDTWTRLKDFLGETLTEDLISDAIDRVNYIRDNMTYSMMNFTFYEEPVQAHRTRTNFFTKSMHSPNAKANSNAIEKLIKDIRDDLTLICTPMKVILTAYHPMPKNIHPIEVLLFETKHDFCTSDPDFDNVLKAYCDMIQNHIILNDDLVCSSEFNKYYSLKPRVELSVIYTDSFASEYTYKRIKSRKSYKEQEHRISAQLLIPLPKKRGKNHGKKK